MLDEGRTVYISHADLQKIVEQMSRNGWQWQISRQLTPPRRIETRQITDKFAISIFGPDGMRQTLIDPKKICSTLEPFDSALHEPRALWEFKVCRSQYVCKVPNLNREEYIEHDMGDR
jgi:hypothetical protein